MSTLGVDFYDKAALLERLTVGQKRSGRPAVFLVGSAATAPSGLTSLGVPSVAEVINLIRTEFVDAPFQCEEFDKAIGPAQNKYQAAFFFLIGRRGQEAANNIIKRAVWQARKNTLIGEEALPYLPSSNTSDDACRALDSDLEGWGLPPAAEALGRLASHYPDYFGNALLTTNFDPLLEVAIKRNGGQCFRTVLHRDGNLGQTEASGCHVIHLHGYWYGADTLHTPRQLNQPRERLKASLAALIKSNTLVVMGYGGWDDTFTEALMQLVTDDAAYPEIIWTLKDTSSASDELIKKLSPAIDRGRLNFYADIDCHQFLPTLFANWQKIEAPSPFLRPASASIPIGAYINFPIEQAPSAKEDPEGLLEGAESDRPPLVDICVGRERELARIAESAQKFCFVTGFGGQGKSTVAAQYFSRARKGKEFDYFIWRDCKEESERFESQVIAVIERLSNRAVRANELSHQTIDALTDLLVKFAQDKRILFVFDNIDHYVDLENNTLSGNAETFLTTFLSKKSNCRVVMTCRPLIKYSDQEVLAIKLDGLTLPDTVELFARRGADAEPTEIEETHNITNGHAFWVDLIAAQIARNKGALKLGALLDQISKGSGEIPARTLSSIWETLNEKQRIVLRAMAETVKSEAEEQIADYLSGQMNFNQVMRALRSLRSLNLIVVKPRTGSADVLELHPLVREFIRRTFPKQERMSFIDGIIAVYKRYIGQHKDEIKQRATQALLHYWSESTELYVSAGRLKDAFECLYEVREQFEASAWPGEFARVAELLLSQVDWQKHASYPHFDSIVRGHIRILTNLGRETEVRRVLDRYKDTVPAKDARYVAYCDAECYVHWMNGRYRDAIQWGERGKQLKDKSGVDTRYGTEHHLALAWRDGGLVDPALTYFLHGKELNTIIDIDEFDENRGGPFYGNIGRCLHLMGQIDPALVCYRKSAISLQTVGDEHVENQGYIRKWIGELLIVKGDFCSAKVFLDAATAKWDAVCPRRIPEIEETLKKIERQTSTCKPLTGLNIERYCIAWIYGRESDFVAITES
jgi:tetratricopeptide (TPR) repeat protein